MRLWCLTSHLTLVLTSALALACNDTPARPSANKTLYNEAERARLVQCCQGLVHEAWNSDPPNAGVLYAARSCEALAKEGRFREAREKLAAAGHATTCNKCPLHGCRRM